MEMIKIEAGFTSITVRPDPVSFPSTAGHSNLQPGRAATGARVTLEFVTSEPLAHQALVFIRYDIAENGELREFTCVPHLTHVTRLPLGLATYHYRASHWIPAEAIRAVNDDMVLTKPQRLPLTATAA